MKIILNQPFAFSFTGQRENNEDVVFPEFPTPNTRLFVVCDGIGGWDKGEIASSLVAGAIIQYFEQRPPVAVTQNYLMDVVNHAHLVLAEYLQQNPLLSRMGSTMALLYLDEGGATIAHIGDSRVYHLRDGFVLHQTQDHRYVLELVAEGIITQEQAKTHPRRNSLSRSIGVKANEANIKIDEPTIYSITDIQAGDYFFLCTDGVLEQLTEEKLMGVFREDDNDASKMAKVLCICQDQTRDNYSGCLVPISEVVIKNGVNSTLPPKKRSLWQWLGLMLFLLSHFCSAQKEATYAILVGISDYKSLDYRTGDLRFADKDAQRIKTLLMRKAGGSVPERNIRLLTNSNASQRNILKALQLFQRATANDRVVFYFSGHGMKGGLVPYDVSRNQPSSILSHQALKTYFKSSEALTKLCIVDACLSGTMTAKTVWGISDVETAPQKADVVLMLSSRATQTSIESSITRGGLFTFFLLNGLRGKADLDGNRLITVKELYQYVSPLVKKNAINRQAPTFYGNFSDNLTMSYVK